MPDPSTPCRQAAPYGLTVVSGVARPQGEQPVAVFYPLGYPTPNAYGNDVSLTDFILAKFYFVTMSDKQKKEGAKTS
jgi:hypothetical protein